MTPNEYTLVEKPILNRLKAQGYRYIHPDAHPTLRPRENEVLFKPLLIDALIRINAIPLETATAIFNDLAGLTDPQKWLEILRGHYSRKIPGEETHRTIRVIDFDHLAHNDFACTNQLRVQGDVVRKPDVIVYINGIPLVVIEAKAPSTRPKMPLTPSTKSAQPSGKFPDSFTVISLISPPMTSPSCMGPPVPHTNTGHAGPTPGHAKPPNSAMKPKKGSIPS